MSLNKQLKFACYAQLNANTNKVDIVGMTQILKKKKNSTTSGLQLNGLIFTYKTIYNNKLFPEMNLNEIKMIKTSTNYDEQVCNIKIK